MQAESQWCWQALKGHRNPTLKPSSLGFQNCALYNLSWWLPYKSPCSSSSPDNYRLSTGILFPAYTPVPLWPFVTEDSEGGIQLSQVGGKWVPSGSSPSTVAPWNTCPWKWLKISPPCKQFMCPVESWITLRNYILKTLIRFTSWCWRNPLISYMALFS